AGVVAVGFRPVGAEVAAAQEGGDDGEGPVVVGQAGGPQQGGDGRVAGQGLGPLQVERDAELAEDFADQVGGRRDVPGGDDDPAGRHAALQQGVERAGDQPGLADRAGGLDQSQAGGVGGRLQFGAGAEE